MTKVERKVPVSRRALLARINRALRKEGEVLKATRADRWRGDLGDYYTVDTDRNAIVAQHVDPEELGRRLGVLADYEEVRDD
jgi:hypothetical protein